MQWLLASWHSSGADPSAATTGIMQNIVVHVFDKKRFQQSVPCEEIIEKWKYASSEKKSARQGLVDGFLNSY